MLRLDSGQLPVFRHLAVEALLSSNQAGVYFEVGWAASVDGRGSSVLQAP